MAGKAQYAAALPQSKQSLAFCKKTRLKTEVRSKLYWLPLTPEHGFPSLHIPWPRALPLGQAAKCGIGYPPLRKLEQKSRVQPLRVPLHKANKNFLRRHYPHQVKGSKALLSSQPLSAQRLHGSPGFFFEREMPKKRNCTFSFLAISSTSITRSKSFAREI